MIDWRKVTQNLSKRGIGMTQAATVAGIPAGQLSSLWTGRALEPPFSVGVKLLDLHFDRCPDLHNDILEL